MVWKNFTLAVVALVGAMSLGAFAQNGDNPSGQCSNCYVQMDGQQGGEGTSAGSAPAVQDAWDSAYLNLSTGALDALIPSDAAEGSTEEDLPSEGSSLDASGGGSVGWVSSYQTGNYGLEMFGVNSNWSGGVGYVGTPAQRTAAINSQIISQTMPLVLMTVGGFDSGDVILGMGQRPYQLRLAQGGGRGLIVGEELSKFKNFPKFEDLNEEFIHPLMDKAVANGKSIRFNTTGYDYNRPFNIDHYWGSTDREVWHMQFNPGKFNSSNSFFYEEGWMFNRGTGLWEPNGKFDLVGPPWYNAHY